MAKEYIIKSEKGDHVFHVKSKRALVGMIATIVDNNLIDLSKQYMEIWDKDELEKASGIKQ